MIKRIQTHWHLFWHLRKLHLMRQLEFRGNFLFWMSVSIMWTTFNFFFFALISQVGNGIGSWSQYEVYATLGVFTIIDAWVWSLFYPSMKEYTASVFSGDLNTILTKPINPQFFLMFRLNNYTNVPRFFLGIVLLLWSLHQLQYAPTWWQWLLFGWCVLVGMTFVYVLWFMLSTLSFWVERLDNINEVIPGLRHIWQVPREVYIGSVSTLITVVVPIALVGALPSEVVLNRGDSWGIVYLTLFTVALLILSHRFFNLSVKKYSGMAN